MIDKILRDFIQRLQHALDNHELTNAEEKTAQAVIRYISKKTD